MDQTTMLMLAGALLLLYRGGYLDKFFEGKKSDSLTDFLTAERDHAKRREEIREMLRELSK